VATGQRLNAQVMNFRWFAVLLSTGPVATTPGSDKAIDPVATTTPRGLPAWGPRSARVLIRIPSNSLKTATDSAFTAFGELIREVGKLKKGERAPELIGCVPGKGAGTVDEAGRRHASR
jgi:hypothetical protein